MGGNAGLLKFGDIKCNFLFYDFNLQFLLTEHSLLIICNVVFGEKSRKLIKIA